MVVIFLKMIESTVQLYALSVLRGVEFLKGYWLLGFFGFFL